MRAADLYRLMEEPSALLTEGTLLAVKATNRRGITRISRVARMLVPEEPGRLERYDVLPRSWRRWRYSMSRTGGMLFHPDRGRYGIGLQLPSASMSRKCQPVRMLSHLIDAFLSNRDEEPEPKTEAPRSCSSRPYRRITSIGH